MVYDESKFFFNDKYDSFTNILTDLISLEILKLMSSIIDLLSKSWAGL